MLVSFALPLRTLRPPLLLIAVAGSSRRNGLTPSCKIFHDEYVNGRMTEAVASVLPF